MYTFSTSQLPKVFRAWCALYILAWKCALRHHGVHFFDITTSKSAPSMVCFVYMLTWECASRHNGVHCLDISTSNSLKVSKRAPMLRCFVHFDFEMCFAPQLCAIFHLSSGQLALQPPNSEPIFRPARSTNHWKKHSVSPFLPFRAPASSFF